MKTYVLCLVVEKQTQTQNQLTLKDAKECRAY